jgi:hypothetical protein
MAIDTTSPRTRRAILMGALGGVVASVAAAVGRASPASATDGNQVLVGHSYTSTTATEIDATGVNAIIGISDSQTGIGGGSTSGTGVSASSSTGTALLASSTLGNAILATSGGTGYALSASSDKASAISALNHSAAHAAIFGESLGGSPGVYGTSGPGGAPSPKTGVFGFANQDATAVGIKGQSPKGRGGVFSGGKAQVRLVPSSASTHPNSGAKGDLFVDNSGRLWFYNGAVWKQVSLV